MIGQGGRRSPTAQMQMFQTKICTMILPHTILYMAVRNMCFDVTECKYRNLIHDYPCSIMHSLLEKNFSTTSFLCKIAYFLWNSKLLAKLMYGYFL